MVLAPPLSVGALAHDLRTPAPLYRIGTCDAAPHEARALQRRVPAEHPCVPRVPVSLWLSCVWRAPLVVTRAPRAGSCAGPPPVPSMRSSAASPPLCLLGPSFPSCPLGAGGPPVSFGFLDHFGLDLGLRVGEGGGGGTRTATH